MGGTGEPATSCYLRLSQNGSDLSERVHQLKTKIRIKARNGERDVWPVRNRILDMERVGKMGWFEKLEVQVEESKKETV